MENPRQTITEIVAEFMEAAGQPIDSLETAKLYRELVAEEFRELIDGFELFLETGSKAALIETLDGIADTQWCLEALALSLGCDLTGAMREVARSNMSKVSESGRIEKNSLGKVKKPKHYSPPDLERYVPPRQLDLALD